MLPNEGSVVKSEKNKPKQAHRWIRCRQPQKLNYWEIKIISDWQSVQHTKFPTMILTTSTVKIAIGSAIFWMCGVYALESLWSHTGTIIFSTKPAFVCYRWILSCCIFHDELLVDCSWGPSFKINVILQGRAAQRQSSLSLFEMIIGPCGITDAGEVGGTDAGADAKRQKYMWIVMQINAK